MSVKEEALGKGTIAYHGERPEYWANKTVHFRRRRSVITAVLAAVGLLLVVYAGSPLMPVPVTGTVVQAGGADDTSRAVVSYAYEGATHTATVGVGDDVVVGQSVGLLVGPAHRVVTGDASSNRNIWLIGIVLLSVAGARAVWAWSRREERITFR